MVSTKVGGVPEILPEDMIEFARADEEDVIRALSHAIQTVISNSPKSGQELEGGKLAGDLESVAESGSGQWERHKRVKEMYDWAMVARRTGMVYRRALEKEERDVGDRLAR